MKTKQFTIAFILLSTTFFILTACKKDEPGANEVFMQDNMFDPSSFSISAGTTITWTNKENSTHTVTSNTDLFDSGDLGNGKSFSYTFSAAGTYNYHCRYHSGMTGVIIVN